MGGPGAPLPGLPGDDGGGSQQGKQVVGGAGQSPAPAVPRPDRAPTLAKLCCLGLCSAQRSPGIDQHALRVSRGGLGQVGELTGDALHAVFVLITAQLAAGSQFRGDPVCPLSRSAGAVPQPGSHRPAGVADPLSSDADPAMSGPPAPPPPSSPYQYLQRHPQAYRRRGRWRLVAGVSAIVAVAIAGTAAITYTLTRYEAGGSSAPPPSSTAAPPQYSAAAGV